MVSSNVNVIDVFVMKYLYSGFWLRVDTYEEQPDVKFKHEVLAVMYLKSGGYVTWSTYKNYNNLQMDYFRILLLKVIRLIIARISHNYIQV